MFGGSIANLRGEVTESYRERKVPAKTGLKNYPQTAYNGRSAADAEKKVWHKACLV
jgi:hypothetical protein